MKKTVDELRSDFLRKAKDVHGDEYDYSVVDYKNTTTKIIIICRKHGPFSQAPVKHLRGQQCGKCAGNKKLTANEFVERANQIHFGKYDYTNVTYRNIDTKVVIGCLIHGRFEQTPYEHLRGHGCSLCGNRSLTEEEFIAKAKVKYGNVYDYTLVKYRNKKSAVVIGCMKHGNFKQTPLKHLDLSSRGCPQCVIDARQRTTEEFVKSAICIHGYKYEYNNVNYVGVHSGVDIQCPIHGVFVQRANDHLNNHGCSKCQTVISKGHQELISNLPSGIEIICNTRDIIKPYEIDIWIPTFKMGIEFHGYYWHGVNSRTWDNRSSLRQKHYLKSKLAISNGVKLVQVYDFEFDKRKELIMSMINHNLGLSTRFYARQCLVEFGTHSEFYDANHLYGNRDSKYSVSLISGDQIVAAMSLSAHPKYQYEIMRYCCRAGTVVVGGFSKCLAAFIKRLSPKSIFSFSDRRFGAGGVYVKNEFMFAGTTKPSYRYVKHDMVLSRNKCQKKHLINILGQKFDESKSEVVNMINNGFTQVFDAGHDKWLLKL